MDRFIVNFIFIIILILISVKDIKYKIIPDSLTVGIILLGVIKIFLGYGSFEKSVIGMGVYPIIFIIIYGYISDIFKRELIGFGDIKLMGAIGFYKGYSNIFDIIFVYNTIFIFGFIFILIAFFIKKIGKNTQIPFAPFISLGFLIFDLWGNLYEKI